MNANLIKVSIILIILNITDGYKSYAKIQLLSDKIQINQQIKKEDWQYFLASDPRWYKEVWAEVNGSDQRFDLKRLSQWNWSWKLAWLTVCPKLDTVWCLRISKHLLRDKALVVRQKAVRVIGKVLKAREDAGVTSLLQEEFKNPRNLRNGQSLPIHKNILYALYKMGGKNNKTTAQALASKFKNTKEYWKKISR